MEEGKAINVLEIVKEYLIQNEYDGLYNTAGGCVCLIENLAPCSKSCSDCEPGYKDPYLCGGGHERWGSQFRSNSGQACGWNPYSQLPPAKAGGL